MVMSVLQSWIPTLKVGVQTCGLEEVQHHDSQVLCTGIPEIDPGSQLTSLVCSCMLLMGFAAVGAATSHTLMLPSPHEDTRIFSFSCAEQPQSHDWCCKCWLIIGVVDAVLTLWVQRRWPKED